MTITTITKEVPVTMPETVPEVTGYDTDLRFYATRYKQGGRTVYSLDLSPAEMRALVPKPDPSTPTPGNRAIRPQHAADFARYIREHEQWVAPALILRAPAVFEFEQLYEIGSTRGGIVSFPRNASRDIHILDGQHRILGFHLADEGIAIDLDKARSQLAAARRQDGPDGSLAREAQRRIDGLNGERDRLSKERVSLQIYIEEDIKSAMQIFFDIAENQLGMAAAVKVRFDQTRVVNRALEYVLSHPLLDARVQFEKDSVTGSPYLFSAKHVAEIIRTTIVGLDGRVSRLQDKAWNEIEVAQKANDFFDKAVAAFDPIKTVLLGQITPNTLRKTSLLGSVLFLRVLAGVEHDLKWEHAFTDEMVENFFELLAPHMSGPVYPGSIWMEHVDPSIFGEGGMAPRGRRQDLKLLKNTLVDWAIEKPAFLHEAPAPRPVAPVVDELNLTEEQADEVLRPETAKARARKK